MEQYGNTTTYNMEPVLLQNIKSSQYWAASALGLESVDEVIDEIYNWWARRRGVGRGETAAPGPRHAGPPPPSATPHQPRTPLSALPSTTARLSPQQARCQATLSDPCSL